MTTTLRPVDLWALGRALCGRPLNSELEAVSEPLRPIFRGLADLPPEPRAAAWNGFLWGRPDAEDIVRALAAVDPDGPPPAVDPHDGGADEPVRPRVKLTRVSDVPCRDIEWIWENRVPRGMLSLFAGDPKLGKSLVTIALAAAVSRRAPLPLSRLDLPAHGSVVLLSAEDDPSRTIAPRLKAAGADLSRIHLLEAVYLRDGSEALPSLRSDVDAIEAAIDAAGDVDLVVVDPVSAYIGSTDDHKNSELRGMLSPLKALAERRGVAVVLVTHLNKGGGTNAKHRVSGSIAYVGACRANFLFVKDQDDPTGRRVFMLSAGCNLTEDPPTLAYRVESPEGAQVVTWEQDPVQITAEDALQPADPESSEKKAKRAECEQWLREVLAGGPALQKEVMKEGKAAGFTESDLHRARNRIGATARREGFGPGSRSFWDPPASDSETR